MSDFVMPKVFVSAASADLRSAREVVVKALNQIECTPVEQSISGTEYGKIREMQERWIAPCQAVVHVVGPHYGGEPDPDSLPDGQDRRSWTQMEYDYAIEQDKKLYVIVCDESFPFDERDQPERQDKADLQQQHRQSVLASDYLWNTAKDLDELRSRIVELKLPLDELRTELVTVDTTVKKTSRKLGRWILGVAAMVLLSIGIGGYVAWQQRAARDEATQVEDVGKQFAKRFLDKLIRDKRLLVEDARKQALADLPDLTGLSAEAIQEIIDGRITQLAKDVGATPLERARAKLPLGDYDGVLDEAAKQRTDTREMEMLAGTAALAKFRTDPQPHWSEHAAAAFLRALALSDQKAQPLAWADAAVEAAFVLDDLTRFDECEALLGKALKLREANLGLDAPEVAIALNNLAQLLKDTNRLAEAEPLMRRALAIDEQSYGAEHPEVAIRLNNLAALLQATNRLAEAEPLMRRALAIDEQSYGAEHPVVADWRRPTSTTWRSCSRPRTVWRRPSR